MPDFGEFADDAKKLASEHPEQADQAFDKAADFANQETGNRFGSEVQRGEQAGENYMGVQDQGQGGYDQSQGQGGGQYGDQSQGQGGGQYGDQSQGQGGGQHGDQSQGQGGDQSQGGYDQSQSQGGGQYGDQGDQGQGGGQY